MFIVLDVSKQGLHINTMNLHLLSWILFCGKKSSSVSERQYPDFFMGVGGVALWLSGYLLSELLKSASLNPSARISYNFPTGKGLMEFSFLKSAGQICDNSQQSIPSVLNFNVMFNKISMLIKFIALFQQHIKLCFLN